jgi:hypothetical protein
MGRYHGALDIVNSLRDGPHPGPPPQELAANISAHSDALIGKFLGGGGEPIPKVLARKDGLRLHYLQRRNTRGPKCVDTTDTATIL